jgi:hypothetical protein
MLWNTQIHKDCFFILAALLFVYGWTLFCRMETWNSWKWPLRAWGIVMGGGIIAWIIRQYTVPMMFGVSVGLALFLSGMLILRVRQGLIGWRGALTGVLVVWCTLASLFPLTVSSHRPASGAPAADAYYAIEFRRQWQAKRESVRGWSNLMPKCLDPFFFSMGMQRRALAENYKAGSNMDTNVVFSSAMDIIGYVPRAAQIAFLGPFPQMWLKSGVGAGGTLMRRVAAVEMVGVYLTLAFLPVALWRWRRREAAWIVLIFCSGMMVIYATVMCNMGTLYRVRYAFLMTCVGMGMAGLLEIWRNVWSKKRGTKNGNEPLCARPPAHSQRP